MILSRGMSYTSTNGEETSQGAHATNKKGAIRPSCHGRRDKSRAVKIDEHFSARTKNWGPLGGSANRI